MYTKMKNIATIFTGHTFRFAPENDPNGDLFLLQAKNIGKDDGFQVLEELIRVASKNLKAPKRLLAGDILLVSKGMGAGSFRSTVFNLKNKNFFVSSSVIVIRLLDVTIDPVYLSLYLNSPSGQKSLMTIASAGATLRTISTRKLEGMNVFIPSIQEQRSLIALHENIQKQEEIHQKHIKLKRSLFNTILQKQENNIL